MKNVIARSFLFVPEQYFTPELELNLTIRNTEYARMVSEYNQDPKDVPVEFLLFKRIETSKGVYYRIPRYALSIVEGKPFADTLKVCSKVAFGKSPIKFNITPRDKSFSFNESQMKTIGDAWATLSNEYGAIISAPTGEGKTVIAIKLIQMIGQKTLVLVHKDALMTQWREQILAMTDLKPDDIGLLKAGKFVDGKIVLGSQQSLMRGTIDNKVNSIFGFIIQDECHLAPAKMFLRSFTRFNTTYRLGLSATPERSDKMERLFHFHISKNFIVHTPVRKMTAQFLVVQYERPSKFKWYPPFIPLKTAVVHNIVADEKRQQLLMNIILHYKDRKLLVLSERTKQLLQLMAITKQKLPKHRIVRFFGDPTLSKKEKAMGMKQAKIVDPTRDVLLSADIVFATYKKAAEGTDIPHLDTMLFATPFGSTTTLIQAKGRIERFVEGKPTPLVIDIYDEGHFLCEGMGDKRLRTYASLGMREIFDKKIEQFVH